MERYAIIPAESVNFWSKRTSSVDKNPAHLLNTKEKKTSSYIENILYPLAMLSKTKIKNSKFIIFNVLN